MKHGVHRDRFCCVMVPPSPVISITLQAWPDTVVIVYHHRSRLLTHVSIGEQTEVI